MTFNITQHCKERYIERVLGGLNNSPNLYVNILKDLSSSKNITSNIRKISSFHFIFKGKIW